MSSAEADEPQGSGPAPVDPPSGRPRRSRARAPRPVPPRSAEDVTVDLLQLVLTTSSTEAFLEELVSFAGGLNPVIAGCGITMSRGSQVMSVAVSNALAGAVDEVQQGLGQGPSLHVLATGRALGVDDLAVERRFGDFPARARQCGVASTFTAPLVVSGSPVAALTAYSRTAHSFTRPVRQGLTDFAAQAEVALSLALRAAAQSDVAEQLQASLHVRSTIDQAVGIVMTQQDCTPERAFAVLRSTARTRQQPIGDVARELVASFSNGRPRAGRSS